MSKPKPAPAKPEPVATVEPEVVETVESVPVESAVTESALVADEAPLIDAPAASEPLRRRTRPTAEPKPKPAGYGVYEIACPGRESTTLVADSPEHALEQYHRNRTPTDQPISVNKL